MRLTSEPVPFFGQQLPEGPEAPETDWKFVLRTRLKSADRRVVVADPFAGGLLFVVSGVGPWDPEPDVGFQPDVLAARLLWFRAGVAQMGRSLMISVDGLEALKMRVARQRRWRATRIFTTSQLRTSSSCATACGLVRSARLLEPRRTSALSRVDGLELLKPAGVAGLPGGFCCGRQQTGGQFRKSQQVRARCRAAGVAYQPVQPPDRQRVQPGRGVPRQLDTSSRRRSSLTVAGMALSMRTAAMAAAVGKASALRTGSWPRRRR